MKIAYRIVTPILAVAGIVMGFFLKMFSFTIGNADDQINNLISAVSSLTSGKFSTLYEYSLFDIVKMAVQRGNGGNQIVDRRKPARTQRA